MIKRLDRYRQIAEEKRLLYVATTRAQDQLILIGSRTNEPSYSKWLEQSIGNDYEVENAPGLPGTIEQQSQTGVAIPEIHPPSSPAETCPVPPSKPFPTKTHWTPTEISAFQHCPWKYYLSSIEVLSEDGPFQPDSRGQKAALIGSAVHEILEIESQFKEGQRERLVALRAERLAPLFPGQEGSIRDTIDRHLDRVTSSTFYRRIQQAAKVYNEKQFHLEFRGRTLTGIMDRLFQESDGRWIVVDFKTNQLRTEDIQEKVRFEGYDLQLELYLWAISQILSTRQVEGVLFFTHTGDLVRFPLTKAVDIRCRKLLEGLPDRIQPELFPKTDRSEYCQACEFFRGGLCMGNRPRQTTLWGDEYGT
jgi:ATP-dependent exoDNAse (exonuclease V) beta subunit